METIKYLALFIFLVICYIIWKNESKKGLAIFFSVFVGPLATGIVMLLIIGALNLVFPHQEYLASRIPIHGLSNSSKTQGSFFLGTGKVNNVDYYYFFEESNRGVKLERSVARHTYIKEYDGTPEKRVYGFEYQNDFLRKNGFPTMCDTYTVLYVPIGTVIAEYNVDLKDF